MHAMNYEKICRVCMNESRKMHDIFVENKASMGKKICDSIMSISSVKITENDGFPTQLCSKCAHILESAINFKRQCEESDAVFHKAVQESHKANLEETHTAVNIKQEDSLDFLDNNEHFGNVYEESHYIEYKPDPDVEEKPLVEDVKVKSNKSSKVYSCNICGKCYTSSKSLKSHMVIHEGGGHNCYNCDRVFARRDHLKKHLQRVHNIEDVDAAMKTISLKNVVKYDCEYCGVDAPNKLSMAKHMKACHKDKLPKRKNSFADIFRDSDSDDNADEPKQEIEIDMVDDRKTIGSVTTSTGGAVATIKEQKQENSDGVDLVLEVKYCCTICGIKYSNQHSYAAHMTKHSGPVPKGQTEFKCTLCDKVFSKRKNLKQHVLIHNKEKANKCTLCHRAFTRPDQLILHMNNHTGKKRHQCTFCDKGFNMLSTLKDHIRTHSGEKPYLCPTCGKGFTQNTNLKQHIMRHNATKPFACPMCQSRFVSKGELDAHLRKHTGDHPFVCDTCGSGFTTSSSLVKHKRIHTGERPYACDLCPLRFAALGTLKNHRRTHTGEKPFACTHCSRAFAQKSDLVSHIRTHTGERPYVCIICGTPYQQSSALKAHIKVHHPLLSQDSKIQTTNANANPLLQTNQSQANATSQLDSPVNPLQLTTCQINTSSHNTIIISSTPRLTDGNHDSETDFKISTPENSQSPQFSQSDSV